MAVFTERKMVHTEHLPERVAQAAADTIFAFDRAVAVWYRIGERRKLMAEMLRTAQAGKFIPSQVDQSISDTVTRLTLIDNWLIAEGCADGETVVFEPMDW